MFGILDRYITRELILPFLLGLVVFTFLLMIQPLGDYSEQLIAKGVSWGIVVRVLGRWCHRRWPSPSRSPCSSAC